MGPIDPKTCQGQSPGAGGRIWPSPDFQRRDENRSHLRWHLALRWPGARTQCPGLAEPELRSSWWVWVCVLGGQLHPPGPSCHPWVPRGWGTPKLGEQQAQAARSRCCWAHGDGSMAPKWGPAAEPGSLSSFPSPPAVWCHAKHPGLSGRSTPGCSCRAQSTPAHAGKHPRSWGDIPNDAPQPVCLRNGVVGGRMPPTPLWRWDPVQAAGHGAQPSPATSTVSHGPALAPAGFLRRDSAPALPGGNGSHGVPQNSPWDPSPMWQAGEGGSCIVGGQGGGGNWPCPGEQGAGWERGSWL